MDYEAVIGLEVHVQIKTRSKMFARVAAGYGEPPNTLIDPVVLALPGSLPVMNKKAIDQIIRTGLLFGCDIAPVCKWDRKNYFYPDSPKNYQISQYDQPICRNGFVEIELPGPARNIMGEHKKIALTRIHLEEDVGKLNHFDTASLVDYNRAGTPLMEIVTEPVLRSPEEVFAFLTALRQAMVCAGISDCDMEKGQLRCDANISIRPVGETKLGVKVELKNLNTISGVRDGVSHEIARQKAVLASGGTIYQETRRFDPESGTSSSMRRKERAHDYRYFPDPDLMPVKVDDAWLSELRATLPELPFDRQRRYFEDYKLPYTITAVLCPDAELSAYFEEAAKLSGKAQACANFICNDLLRDLTAAKLPLSESKIRPAHIAALVALVEDGTINSNGAKEVFAEMFATGEQPGPIVDRKGLRQSNDVGLLEELCRAAIEANPASVADYKSGKLNAINALKGHVMKAGKGKVNPKLVDDTLKRLIG
jgi:aspartyl-tRNA(Asn)/glutamyl-tRNA(Gln) amidotransferase subunit B